MPYISIYTHTHTHIHTRRRRRERKKFQAFSSLSESRKMSLRQVEKIAFKRKRRKREAKSMRIVFSVTRLLRVMGGGCFLCLPLKALFMSQLAGNFYLLSDILKKQSNKFQRQRRITNNDLVDSGDNLKIKQFRSAFNYIHSAVDLEWRGHSNCLYLSKCIYFLGASANIFQV